MKTIKGICIKKRNFDKFKKVADLILVVVLELRLQEPIL